MSIARSLLPEFDHELATTRTLLERIPDDKAAWKPHPKSMALGQLGAHIVTLQFWAQVTVREREFDANPPGGPPHTSAGFTSAAALVARLDEQAAVARGAIAAATDEELMVPWSLRNGGRTIFTMPRSVVLRSFVMNHMIHHRGQLSVYLRLLDVPLPPIYGPTADS